MSLATNILDDLQLNQTLKDSLLKASTMLSIDLASEYECIVDEYLFETDGYDTIRVKDWWRVGQDLPVFPIANTVSGEDYIPSTEMKYYAGHIMNQKDTTIPIYEYKVRNGVLYDIMACMLYSICSGDYKFADVCYKSYSQLSNYYRIEEKIEEVENGILDETDCYEL